MAKTLNEDALKNELAGSSFFMKAETPDSPTPPESKTEKPKRAIVEKKSVDQPVIQSIDQSIDRPSVDHSAVMGKPRGFYICLLYTSDAADDLLCVDLGGRR